MAIEPNPGGNKAIKSILESLGGSQNGESNHEALNGLLGGNSAGHYHLTKEQLDNLSAHPDTVTNNHEQLEGLLGGSPNAHYHLTVDLLNKLINLPANGASGSGGTAATIQIGSVTTGAAGSSASVTNSGTSSNAIFNFVIPKGDKGDKGDSGSGGGESAFKLVKYTYSEYGSYNREANPSDNKDPTAFNDNMRTFIVPEGVHTIYVSACAGGGGMYTQGDKLLSGWSGGQFINSKLDVNPGDTIEYWVGLGGAENCCGQNTRVRLNGRVVLEVYGGDSGNHTGSRDDTDPIISSTSPLTTHGFEASHSPLPQSLDTIRSLAASKGISSHSFLDFILEALISPNTALSPYGEGGCVFNSTLVHGKPFEGMPGIIIFEYIEPVV